MLEAAEEQLEAAAGSAPKNGKAAAKEPFSREELKAFFAKNAAQIVAAHAPNQIGPRTLIAAFRRGSSRGLGDMRVSRGRARQSSAKDGKVRIRRILAIGACVRLGPLIQV